MNIKLIINRVIVSLEDQLFGDIDKVEILNPLLIFSLV